MSSVPLVSAVSPAMLERLLRDPRVVNAAARVGVELDSSDDLAKLLVGTPPPPAKPRQEPQLGSAPLTEDTLFTWAGSESPKLAIRAYQEIAALN